MHRLWAVNFAVVQPGRQQPHTPELERQSAPGGSRVECPWAGNLAVVQAGGSSLTHTKFPSSHFVSCLCSRVECPWAVNFAVVQPGGSSLTVAVGDSPEGLLMDWATGKTVATLKGHFDYSFAAAWHPDGNVFATGNQVSGILHAHWRVLGYRQPGDTFHVT